MSGDSAQTVSSLSVRTWTHSSTSAPFSDAPGPAHLFSGWGEWVSSLCLTQAAGGTSLTLQVRAREALDLVSPHRGKPRAAHKIAPCAGYLFVPAAVRPPLGGLGWIQPAARGDGFKATNVADGSKAGAARSLTPNARVERRPTSVARREPQASEARLRPSARTRGWASCGQAPRSGPKKPKMRLIRLLSEDTSATSSPSGSATPSAWTTCQEKRASP
jgi:hypothetical protein